MRNIYIQRKYLLTNFLLQFASFIPNNQDKKIKTKFKISLMEEIKQFRQYILTSWIILWTPSQR